MSLSFLQTIGLTKTEAELYELLLKLGEVPATTIITESKLKKPTCYKFLYSLEKRGLVSIKDKNGKLHFQPAPPQKLLELAQQQYSDLDRAKESIQALLPNLTSTYILSVEKPVIKMYEGVEGVKKAHLEVLAEKKEILAYVRVDKELDKPLDDFWPRYYRIRKQKKIFVRSIVPNNKEGVEYKKDDRDQLRETRLVPLEKFPFAIEKNIVGDKVVFFSRQENNPIATVIENKEIADAEREIFEMAWDNAERYDEMLSK